MDSESADKKKIHFVPDSESHQKSDRGYHVSEDDSEILENQPIVRTRSRQISFVWNQGFKHRDRVSQISKSMACEILVSLGIHQ